MPNYKNLNNDLFFLDAGIDPSHYLPSGCIEITNEEASAIRLSNVPSPTPEEIAKSLEQAVDRHIDSVAQTKGYDNRITCTMRAGYANPWQAEGVAFGQWMDSCYTYCFRVMADVKAKLRVVPTESELIAELPLIVWPS